MRKTTQRKENHASNMFKRVTNFEITISNERASLVLLRFCLIVQKKKTFYNNECTLQHEA